jgi:hypothetical protein
MLGRNRWLGWTTAIGALSFIAACGAASLDIEAETEMTPPARLSLLPWTPAIQERPWTRRSRRIVSNTVAAH